MRNWRKFIKRVNALADQSKNVRPRDLVAIAHEVIRGGASGDDCETHRPRSEAGAD